MKKLLLLGSLSVAAGLAGADDTALPKTAEIIGLLKTHYVDSDRLDQQLLTEATIGGLLQTLGRGAQILPASQAVAVAAEPATGEPLARAEVIEPAIGYIRVSDVTDGTVAALDGELQKFRDAKVTGFVLDLRFADGTNYAAAAAVASRFVAGQPELFARKQAGQTVEQFRAAADAPTGPGDLPLMVLVNAQTRGAAEVVAGVLRAQDRAILIGARTAGQPVAWQDLPLGDGRVLRVATAKIALAGSALEIFPAGLPPDVSVRMEPAAERQAVLHADPKITLTASLTPAEGKRIFREADLVKAFRGEAIEAPALTLSSNTTTGAVAPAESPAEPVVAPSEPKRDARDIVLERAVDILKGIRVLLSSIR